MKVLFFILLLINLLVAGGYLLSATPARQDYRAEREFHPERVRVLGEAAQSASPSRPVPTVAAVEPGPEQCLVWSGVPAAELVDARSQLAALKARFTVRETRGEQRPRYWVYLPPAKSTPDAERKVAALRAQGLSGSDYFVVRDPGPLRNAISLGVFSTSEAAAQRLADLRERGVSGMESGQRDTISVSDFWVFDGSDSTRDELTTIAARQRGSEILKRDCPAAQ